MILHVAQVLGQGLADRLEQFAVRTTEGADRLTVLLFLREIIGQIGRLLYRHDARSPVEFERAM